MKEIIWLFPETIEKLRENLQLNFAKIHSGGTGLLHKGLSGVERIIDLSKMKWDFIKENNELIEIGSMATYSDVLKAIRKTDKENILIKSLHNAANTPLRNRITIGGSLAQFPIWTDLVGALICLDSKVKIVGKNQGVYLIRDFLKKRTVLERSAIQSVTFEKRKTKNYSFRYIRTQNDMPIFHISINFEDVEEKIINPILIVTGTKNRYSELNEVEDYMRNKKKNEIDFSRIEKMMELEFSGIRLNDPEHVMSFAKTEIIRGLRKLLEA